MITFQIAYLMAYLCFFHKHRLPINRLASPNLPFLVKLIQFLANLLAHLIHKASKLDVGGDFLMFLPLPLEAAEGIVDVYHVFSKKEAIPNLCWDSLAS